MPRMPATSRLSPGAIPPPVACCRRGARPGPCRSTRQSGGRAGPQPPAPRRATPLRPHEPRPLPWPSALQARPGRRLPRAPSAARTRVGDERPGPRLRRRPVGRPAVQPVAGPARSLPCSDRLHDRHVVRAPPAAVGSLGVLFERRAERLALAFDPCGLAIRGDQPIVLLLEDLIDAAVLVAGVLEKLPQLRG